MSNLESEVVQDCNSINSDSALKLVLKPKDRDLGGFSVRRTLPTRGCRSVGPWVFFDHMGPVHFEKGQGIDVRPHPHIDLPPLPIYLQVKCYIEIRWVVKC